MKISQPQEDCDIPLEFEETEQVSKQSVQSPKTKSSKLSLDKGHVRKEHDCFFNFDFFHHSATERVIGTNNLFTQSKSKYSSHKSSNVLWVGQDLDSPREGCSPNKAVLEESKGTGRWDKLARGRTQSSNSEEFKLVPLLRKVSREPPARLPEASPAGQRYSWQISFDENDEGSVSSHGETEDKNVLVTMGDVSPSNKRA